MSSDAQASTSAITDDAPAELWNTILREASSSKATPQKQLVVLGARVIMQALKGLYTETRSASGEPETGKTTLLHMMGVDRQQAPTSSTNSQHLDLALSFDYLDVRDEGEEGPWCSCVLGCELMAWSCRQRPLHELESIKLHLRIRPTRQCFR